MTTIKSYTDLQQSKKLAEILPMESADMFYTLIDQGLYLEVKQGIESSKDDIPCWSLATLISIIPQELFDGEYIINITEGCDNKWILTYDHYENRNHSYYGLSAGADNLVDACYEMIIKLYKQKLL